MKSNRGKAILRTSILATALLGAGVFAGSLKDIENINTITGNNGILESKGDAKGATPVEHQGVYKEWVQYSLKYEKSSGTSYTPCFINYKLNTPKSADATQEYIVGIIVPEVVGTMTNAEVDSKAQIEFLKSGGKSEIEMTMYDIDKMPDGGYTADGMTQTGSMGGAYTKILINDSTPLDNMIDVSTEEQWHELFDLDAVDLYGAFDVYPGSQSARPTSYQSWQHIAYSIPVTDKEYDHLFGTTDVDHDSVDADALYQWGGNAKLYSADAMHVDSNFAVKSIGIKTEDGNSQLYLSPLYDYWYHDYTGTSGWDPGYSGGNEQIATRLSERDDSLWLKYPEPKISVENAKKNDDGNLIVDDGSFADGYTLDVLYEHNVTDEKFTIVHSFDYKLYGPGIKGDGREDVLWDHWYVDDSGIYRQFRTNPEDPTEMSDVKTIATNEVDTNPWLDGKNEIGEEFIVTNPDALDDVDEKDALGDINIALVDGVTFKPGDPDFETGKNKGEAYSTGYLYSESPYNATIDVDGISTMLGTNNSFQWPESKMKLKIGVVTDVYEPWKPVVNKFEFTDDPLHDETGEIKNSWTYTIDAKTEAEFDGTSYYPSKVEYVQLISPDGTTVYSDPIAAATYDEETDGVFTGTLESGNLPANQTDLPIALKLYYGKDVGNATETISGVDGKFWTQKYDTGVTIDTGVRGSADFSTSMNLSELDTATTSTTATLDISVNPIKTIGTEDSITHWSEDLSAYETSDIISGTIHIIGEKPADITDEDMTTWDAGTTWENNTEWILTTEQITELNETGTTSVTIDGLLPNHPYQVQADFVYEGETKPSYADDRWDATWEENRSFTTNPVDIYTYSTLSAAPQNIKLSYEIYDVDEATRNAKYELKLTADVSGYGNDSDIYAPTDVTSVTFNSGNYGEQVITEDAAIGSPSQIFWVYDDENETIEVSYKSEARGMGLINDTVSATITYAGGTISTFDAIGGEGGPLETSISIPDRGNLEVIAAAPVESASTSNSITFTGTIDEIVPVNADWQNVGGTDAIDETQFAKNEGFSVDIVDDKGNILATTDEVTPVTSRTTPAGGTVDSYTYEVTANGLNPNKQYNAKAVVTYNGTSKINDIGYLAGDYPDVNEEKTVESTFTSTPGTTDTLGLQDPSIIEMSDVEIILDETTRDITAKGSFKLDVVSENESAAYASDYSATDVTEIRIKDGDKTVFTLSDTATIDAATNSEIVVDWTVNSADIKAKTDYDLAIEVDWAGGTKTFDAQHITFNSGSRGDLVYTGTTLEEVSNSAGPLLNMKYDIQYEGNNGYDYADFELLKVDSVQLNARYMQDKFIPATGEADIDPDDWSTVNEPLFEASPFTYDGEPKEFSLGYDQLINGLPRFPGAPEADAVNPEDDKNGNGVYDDAYIYDFRVVVEADFPDAATNIQKSSWLRYDQFSFLKGGFTPILRDFELSSINVDEESSEGDVEGSFWIEHRPEGYYDGMLGDEYKYHNEMDMWESGVESIMLYNVSDPERTDFTTPDPLDQVLWTIDEGIPEFFDQPDSYNDTPVTNPDGSEERTAYDAWLAEEHTKLDFKIERLTPGVNYKFKLVTHYTGDNKGGTHTITADNPDGVVSPDGYNQVKDFEFDVPLAGVEEIENEDIRYGAVKSSLTSWTLSYDIKNINVDPTKENYKLKDISIFDENNELLATSTEAVGQLVVTNLMPGTNPIDSGWKISVTTEDEQELLIDLDQEWLENTLNMGDEHIYTDDGEGNLNWSNSESDAIESWDVKVPEDGFISITGEATNVTQTSFDLTLDISDELANLMNNGAVLPGTLQIVDVAREEVLTTNVLSRESLFGIGRTSISDYAGEHTVQVTGLQPGTEYGVEGFDIIFDVFDKYAPVPEGETEVTPVSVVFATTESHPIRTLDEESNLVWLWIIIIILLILSIVGAVLAALWFFMLAWRKEKETDFKPGQVSFLLNKSYSSEAKKLIGAKLTSTAGTLNYTLSEDKSGKILVTVTGITTKEPLKGLKFVLDNSTIKASNAKIDADNKALTAKFEADLKVWEDKKAKTPEGTTFSEPKPAKPTLTKLGKVASDIKIIGAVKTVKPEPKPPKPAAPAKPASAAEGNAKKI